MPHCQTGVRVCAITAVAIVGLAATAWAPALDAAPPDTVRYQARLADDAGVPLSGSHDLTFTLFDLEAGGSIVWSEGPQTLVITNGIVDVTLGTITPLSSSAFTQADRWLEIDVDGSVLLPRRKISSVPFAHAADRLGDQQLADVLDRSNHAGAQPPSTIDPQGDSSGLDADLLDGKHRSEIEARYDPSLSNTSAPANALASNTNGNRNTAFGYLTLAGNIDGDESAAFGAEALRDNTSGVRNTAVGGRALQANTTGRENTAMGYWALSSTTTTNLNSAFGFRALRLNTATSNSAFGGLALDSNTSGSANVAVGVGALQLNQDGSNNNGVGFNALRGNVNGSQNVAFGKEALKVSTGSRNTAVGHEALIGLSGGNDNIAIGSSAGEFVQGSNNILIGTRGAGADSDTIRIGTAQTRFFVAGARGTTTDNADGITLLIDSDGQLGTVSSSIRFKDDVRDLGTRSHRLLDLRPVSFRYRRAFADGETPEQYGLIAEEVAEIMPELVVRDEQGRPETVKYRVLSTLLLNELQNQQETIERHQDELQSIRDEMKQLRRRVDEAGHP